MGLGVKANLALSSPGASETAYTESAVSSSLPTPLTTHQPATLSRSATATTSFVTSGSSGIAALSCTDNEIYSASSGGQYKTICDVNWPAGLDGVFGKEVRDLADDITYNFPVVHGEMRRIQ